MKVAVIIPCYNVAEHVEAAVRSVLAQEHVDLDIVAVDDGSTDATGSILERMVGESNGRLRVVAQGQQGASAARNAGLRASTGEYVQFLDADDVLFPKKIAAQVALIRTRGPASIVAGSYRNRMSDGSAEDIVLSIVDPWEALILGRMGTTSANLWQRAGLESIGGWDETLKSSQDHELAFRLLRSGRNVIFDPSIHTEVLKRLEGSISRQDPLGNWERYIALRAAIRDHLRTKDPGLFASQMDAAEQLLFGAIRIIAHSDRSRAKELFEEYLSLDFRPKAAGGVSAAYSRLYGWLGFDKAERAASAMDTLRHMIGKG